ncbi:MAG: hypothetical protein H6607_04190 [Flavobacteriales bacterium]|nr:hypothetical protein [Flavobacteriales bacterium]
MKKISRIGQITAFACLFLFANQLVAQNYSVEDSRLFLINGLIYHNQEKYNSAIEEYSKVHRNDTNYAYALYEKSFSQTKQKKYKAAIESCIEGLEMNDPKLDFLFYTSLGTAYSESDQFELSIETYLKGIEKYPKSSTLKYNLAVVLLKDKQYERGMEMIYTTLRENPFHANSHLILGNICRDQELKTQAAISYFFYLMMEDNDQIGYARLGLIDGYLSGKMEGENEYKDINFLEQGYSEIDELVENKIANRATYKTPSSLTFPTIKQAHLIINSLDKLEADTGFWNEFYVPMLKRMQKNKSLFEGFSYYLVRSGTERNKLITSAYNGNSSKVSTFRNWYMENFEELYAMQKDEDGNEILHHYAGGILVAHGKLVNDKLEGPVTFYHNSGLISAKGNYKNGEKDGAWVYYYGNGIRKSEYNYDNGVVDGAFKEYNNEGFLEKEGNFKKDYYDGVVKVYYSQGGGIYAERTYENGELTGKYTEYHRNGEKSVETILEKGDPNGEVSYYGYGGRKLSSEYFENGERNGESKVWNTEGILTRETKYVDGKVDGEMKTYYQTGELSSRTEYSAGKIFGIQEEFHKNGQLITKTVFDGKGKFTGVSEAYHSNGNVHWRKTFKKGVLQNYEYFDSLGKSIKYVEKKGSNIIMEDYDENGYMWRKGAMKKGLFDGEFTFYDPLEILVSKRNFVKDDANGDYQFYYSDGTLKTECNYTDDEKDGQFKQYGPDGETITYTGFYVNGSKKGEFISQNMQGKTTDIQYFSKGKEQGWQQYYTEKGVLYQEEYCENGVLLGWKFYDSSGKNPEKHWLENGNGVLERKYQNGQIEFKGQYVNGEPSGEFVWYHPNGKMATTGMYVGGSRHGEWKWFYENGVQKSAINYFYGDRNGEATWYHEDGTLEIKSNYVNGDREGEYTRYFWNGKLREQCFYKDGFLHGVCRYYAPTGELAIVRRFVEDVLVAYSYEGSDGNLVDEIAVTKRFQHIEAKFANGQKSVEFDWENNLVAGGKFIWYYPNGNIYKSSEYNEQGALSGRMYAQQIDGKMLYDYRNNWNNYHGVGLDYHLNGNLKSSINYFQDEMEGVSRFYDENGKLVKTAYYFNNKFVHEIK